jgi:thiamine-phosphate pyrophosphorylase
MTKLNPPPPRLPRHRPLLYLITDRQTLRRHPAKPEAPDDWGAQLEVISIAAAAGCQLIQIRERDLNARALVELTRAACAVAQPHGARVLVNDRVDVALAAEADGVHLRASSFQAIDARAIAQRCGREDFLIGASVHTMGEAEEAERAADFVVCGPVYLTPSKQSYGPPLGIEGFAAIAHAVEIPTLALGGVKMENFHLPLSSGAAGIAAIGLFTEPTTIEERVRTILKS